jgi:hypothetical protein
VLDGIRYPFVYKQVAPAAAENALKLGIGSGALAAD